MTALPSLRSSFGVKSGIRATTGALHSDITKTNKIMKSIAKPSELNFTAIMGIIANNNAEIGAP